MDFKSVGEYNSAVHKICSKLRFCDEPVSDEDLVEKTLFTFLPANRILQQQYWNGKYTKYSSLIHDLAQAEKHDELSTKNHQMRPSGTAPLPEVHFNVQNNKKYGGKKNKKNLSENGSTKGSALRDPTKGKAIKRTTTTTTHKFINDMVVLLIVQINAALPNTWLNYT